MDNYSSRKNKRTITLAVIILLDLALIVGLYFHDHKTSKVSNNSMSGMTMQNSKKSNEHNMPTSKKVDVAPKNNSSTKSSSAVTAIVGPKNGQLVNTGPGDVLAIFGAVFAISAIAHYLLNTRFSTSDH